LGKFSLNLNPFFGGELIFQTQIIIGITSKKNQIWAKKIGGALKIGNSPEKEETALALWNFPPSLIFGGPSLKKNGSIGGPSPLWGVFKRGGTPPLKKSSRGPL